MGYSPVEWSRCLVGRPCVPLNMHATMYKNVLTYHY